MNTLQLELDAGGAVRPLEFAVRRMVNVGYAGRDQAAVRAHIDELAEQGVPPPPSVPLCIPVASRNITLDGEIEIWPCRNSGEAEVVFFLSGKDIFVGVGSDHTDRELEALSIEKSKQICPNVASRRVWRFEEVKLRWDQLMLMSFVAPEPAAAFEPYQCSPLSALLPPRVLLDHVLSHGKAAACDGLVVYSGTVPVLGHPVRDAARFRCELHDETARRMLVCEYSIKQL
ncbi:MAG: DUF2848 family protein [Planctomycetes bacterium]|nr:DUF2848 family protein [Planctomycetota bacterium]